LKPIHPEDFLVVSLLWLVGAYIIIQGASEMIELSTTLVFTREYAVRFILHALVSFIGIALLLYSVLYILTEREEE